MEIAIDFDGTIVEHAYPAVGAPIPGAIRVIKELQAKGHSIMLWTMRSDDKLAEAVEYLRVNDITLDGVNNNPTQYQWTNSPKCYAQLYIDDAALGCPLIYVAGKRPMVDWAIVRHKLWELGVL